MDRKQWNDHGQTLKEEMLEYNWQYRAKICINCPLSVQQKRKCFRVEDSYRIIKGVRIQETHCKWLVKARTAKFRSRILGFLDIGSHTMFGTPLRGNNLGN